MKPLLQRLLSNRQLFAHIASGGLDDPIGCRGLQVDGVAFHPSNAIAKRGPITGTGGAPAASSGRSVGRRSITRFQVGTPR